jgi:magnesium transporter
MAIIGNAVYRNGVKVATPKNLDESFEVRKKVGGFSWIGLYRPDEEELNAVAEEFVLHKLAVEDAKHGHQRAKLERYGDSQFLVLRPAQYNEETDRVVFGELNIFAGPKYVVTVRHSESPNLGQVRTRLEHEDGDLLAMGPLAVVYAILDQVVDEYWPVIQRLENDLDEIETELFTNNPGVDKRIFELYNEVLGLGRAVSPLPFIVDEFSSSVAGKARLKELPDYLRDVRDHALRLIERVDGYRQIIESAMSIHHTRVTQEQNEQMAAMTRASIAQGEEVKKISSWAAIIFAPTLIAGIYGMNFTYMPELNSPWGYPLALVAMVGFAGALYWIFKKRNWL